MKKKVLIFGSEGQLGFDLLRVFKDGCNAVGLNHQQADIADVEIVSKIINDQKPDIVINATAYNKVEAAEMEKEMAFQVNAKGVENLAKASEQVSAVFVHVSTDYVFDGNKEFFTEEDEPNPLNVYGQSKLEGERLAKAASSRCCIIRTSAVFGAKEAKQKMNFVDRIVSLAKEKKELKVVNDQFTSPTYSLDLAQKIKELIEANAPFGIYHITGSGSCSWYGFAKKSLELMGLDAKIEPINTASSGTKVSRPKNSILKNQVLSAIGLSPMPDWQDALKRYLKEKYNI